MRKLVFVLYEHTDWDTWEFQIFETRLELDQYMLARDADFTNPTIIEGNVLAWGDECVYRGKRPSMDGMQKEG